MCILRRFAVLCSAALFAVSCQTAPPINYADQPEVLVERTELCNALLKTLPEKQQKLPEAQKEARYLADTYM